MTEALAILFGLGPEVVLVFSLLVARVGGAMSLLPAFGEQVVPGRIKIAATLAVSTILTPVAWSEISAASSSGIWYFLILSESLIGLLIGIAFRFLIIVLQIAGSIAAQTISLAQLFGGGMGPEPQPAFSTLFVVSGLCIAAMAGLHVQVCELFIRSYELFPIGIYVDAESVSMWGSKKVSGFFAIGLTLAAPFVLAAVIYNASIGVINRAMPQLMVAFVGAPAISFVALALVCIATPLLLFVWAELAIDQFSDPVLGFR